jgi:uncharacterized repeat protein (TIGR03847 family)
MLTVALEKVQVALLAERIGAIAGVTASSRSEEEPAAPVQPVVAAQLVMAPTPTFSEPVVEAFRVGSMTLTYEEEGRHLTLEAQEVGAAGGDDASEPEDDPDLDVLRVRLPLGDAVRFAEGALRVVAAGRPPCPLCGEPLDPQGHICLRRNGYVM